MNRREFLGRALASGATFAIYRTAPGWMLRNALAAETRAAPLLVVLFLRGGADGLNMVPPISGADRQAYESARPSLKVPVSGERAALPLDERFGFHPALAPLHALYKSGELAVIHAAGLVADTRSHFDAQNYVEFGTTAGKSAPSGWLTRHLRSRGLGNEAFQAVSVGSLLPASLFALNDATVIQGIGGFNLAGKPKVRGDLEAALRELYRSGPARGPGAWLEADGEHALASLVRLEAGLEKGKESGPDVTGDYPKGEIGGRLRTLAQLLRMNLGVQAATIDMGGWDTHKYQGDGATGHFAGQLTQLAQAVAAFRSEMSKLNRPLTLIVQTEFGRRLKENANKGTDHGHGGVMMVLGDHVRGGKVYGDWPTLRNERLYEHADLAVTTDYRRVLSEILISRFGERRIRDVFPGYAGYRPLGLMKAGT